MDASNEKALFRRGEALFGMKEFDKAKKDFQQVVQLYPANKAAKSQVFEFSFYPQTILSPQFVLARTRNFLDAVYFVVVFNWGSSISFISRWFSVRNELRSNMRKTK